MAPTHPHPDGPGADASAAVSTAVAPAGSHAVVIHSDLRCPWAHVTLHRLLRAARRLGADADLCIDHRWFPLEEGGLPAEVEALDRVLAPIRVLEPDAGWTTWAGTGASVPASSRLAAAWVQAAKGTGPAASMALDRAFRRAFFVDRSPIDDPATVERIARTVEAVEVDELASEVASGRPDAELDRHAEASRSELVPSSPTVVVADGERWTNPGIEFHVEDGVPVIDRDDPAVHDEIVERFLALRHYD